jgi:hypothetical protein
MLLMPTRRQAPSPRSRQDQRRARLGAARTRWRQWRRSRPLWAGLFSLAGGLTILLLPADQYTVLTLPGTAGFAGFLLGGLIAALGVLLCFQPDHHNMISIAIVLAALASFIYTNLGGFLVGMLLALTGGSLAFAWAPHPRRSQQTPH